MGVPCGLPPSPFVYPATTISLNGETSAGWVGAVVVGVPSPLARSFFWSSDGPGPRLRFSLLSQVPRFDLLFTDQNRPVQRKLLLWPGFWLVRRQLYPAWSVPLPAPSLSVHPFQAGRALYG